MKNRGMRDISKENERESASSLSASEAARVVRRFGFVLYKAHEVMVSRAIANGDEELAELLNDTLKPIADLLTHFTLESE